VVMDRKKAKMVDCQNLIDENRNLGSECVKNQNLAAELANLVMEIDEEMLEFENLRVEQDTLSVALAKQTKGKARFG
jgi:Leu/Phe-tRNA-protein transferase